MFLLILSFHPMIQGTLLFTNKGRPREGLSWKIKSFLKKNSLPSYFFMYRYSEWKKKGGGNVPHFRYWFSFFSDVCIFTYGREMVNLARITIFWIHAHHTKLWTAYQGCFMVTGKDLRAGLCVLLGNSFGLCKDICCLFWHAVRVS